MRKLTIHIDIFSSVWRPFAVERMKIMTISAFAKPVNEFTTMERMNQLYFFYARSALKR